MSWNDRLKNSLINYTDHGRSYKNVLADAAIVGLDGAVWARTEGIDIKPDEIKKLDELFKQSGNNTESITVGGKKYMVTHYEPNPFVSFAYLKIKEGGATIAKTGKAFVVGIYSTAKRYKTDEGRELPQSVGMCNTVVENFAATLK